MNSRTSKTENPGRTAVAVIPARGGSKGIPRKNLQSLCGRPLLAWTIAAALEARSVSRVIVSTDDKEIARTAEQFGAEVIRRPEAISGDSASSESALLHALGVLREEGSLPEILVFLQCTSPLTEAADIDGTVDALEREQADTALAACDFHYFIWRKQASGDATGVNHDKSVRLLRQQREPEYLESGAVYAMRTAGFLESKHRFFGKTALYAIPAERTFEIDEPADLEIAEVLLRQRERRRRQLHLPNPVSAVVFDFDGVMTDNRVLVTETGEEAAACNRSDGWGIGKLKQTGLPLLVLSTEANPIVDLRCRKLGLDCLYGQSDKAGALRQWSEQRGIDPRGIIYVGNDENDTGCLRFVGCPVVVADAHPSVLREALIVLEHQGGDGAVRELIDLVLAQQTGSVS